MVSVHQGLWFGVIALDLGAAWFSGNRQPAGIYPEHFAERHGLIVIIALGESLIVTASNLFAYAGLSMEVIGGIALVITCLLWGTYFGWVKEVLEEKLIELDGDDRALLARDAYTLWHFPLVSGIIALGVGFEVSLHPADYTAAQAAAAIGVGLTLFLASTAAALWRAERCVLWNRLIILALTLGGLAYSVRASARQGLVVAATGLAVIVLNRGFYSDLYWRCSMDGAHRIIQCFGSNQVYFCRMMQRFKRIVLPTGYIERVD